MGPPRPGAVSHGPMASMRRYTNSGKLTRSCSSDWSGFLVFDMLAFWASFRAVGALPELAVIWMAYLIGQLGNWIPVPGGIGGTELGLVGALILYGRPP